MNKSQIGFYLSIGMALFLCFSAFMKLSGSEQVTELLSSNGLADWQTIIGVGELISAVLFVLPQTFRLGTVLLSAYFGGAILFHMNHSVPEFQGFLVPALILIMIWVLSWLRGNNLINLN